MKEHGEEPQDEAAYDRLADLQETIAELSEGDPAWTLQQKAIAGVYVTLGPDGEAAVRRGIVKPEDKAALRRLTKGAGKADDGIGEETRAAKAKGGLPASLLTELPVSTPAWRSRRTARPTHSRCARWSRSPRRRRSWRHWCAAGSGSCRGSRMISGHGWTKQKPETIRGLLAVCAALTIDLVQVNGAAAKPAANDLAKTIKLDMAQHSAPRPGRCNARRFLPTVPPRTRP